MLAVMAFFESLFFASTSLLRFSLAIVCLPMSLNMVKRVGFPIAHLDLGHLEILRVFFSQYFPGEGRVSVVSDA